MAEPWRCGRAGCIVLANRIARGSHISVAHFPSSSGKPPWRARVLTLYPEMFPGPLSVSVVGAALTVGIWALDPIDLRAFGTGKHRAVDDHPAGGGAGMVLRCDVVAAAIDAARGGGTAHAGEAA